MSSEQNGRPMTPEEMTAQIQHLIQSQNSLGDNLDRLYEETTALSAHIAAHSEQIEAQEKQIQGLFGISANLKETLQGLGDGLQGLTLSVQGLVQSQTLMTSNMDRFMQVRFRLHERVERLETNEPPPNT
jgi:chromosome segregation ATPase